MMPSATPLDSSSYDLDEGACSGTIFSALASSFVDTLGIRTFRPSKSAIVRIGRRLLKIWPGPWVNTLSTFVPACSFAFARCLSKTRQ